MTPILDPFKSVACFEIGTHIMLYENKFNFEIRD